MDQQQSQTYQRNLKRYQLTALIDIVERSSQEFVGRLVNVHSEGLMVIGDFQFAENNVYDLDLQLPKTFSERPVISVDADCLWTRPAQEDGTTIWSGFSLIDCSAEAKADIEKLIDAMGV